MCLASNSRVSTTCRSPAPEPSAVFSSFHAASNADAKIFVVSASKTLNERMHWHKGCPSRVRLHFRKVGHLLFAPHRSGCTRKFVNQSARHSDGTRSQKASLELRTQGISDRYAACRWSGPVGS